MEKLDANGVDWIWQNQSLNPIPNPNPKPNHWTANSARLNIKLRSDASLKFSLFMIEMLKTKPHSKLLAKRLHFKICSINLYTLKYAYMWEKYCWDDARNNKNFTWNKITRYGCISTWYRQTYLVLINYCLCQLYLQIRSMFMYHLSRSYVLYVRV